MIEALVKDARFAIRGLQKQPAFTFAAAMALALGIGATTTILSVIQNVLLDPYPMYADVDRIVGVQIRDLASARPGGREWYPVAEFLDYQTQAQSFDAVIAGTGEDVVYSGSAGSEQFVGGLTSGNTFNVLGVRAASCCCAPLARSPFARKGERQAPLGLTTEVGRRVASDPWQVTIRAEPPMMRRI